MAGGAVGFHRPRAFEWAGEVMLDTAPAKTFHYQTRPREAQLRGQADLTHHIGVFPIDAQGRIVRQVIKMRQALEKGHKLWMPKSPHTSRLEGLRGIRQWSRRRWGHRHTPTRLRADHAIKSGRLPSAACSIWGASLPGRTADYSRAVALGYWRRGPQASPACIRPHAPDP